MYLKEKQYKIAMILLCPVQGPWASSFSNTHIVIFFIQWESFAFEVLSKIEKVPMDIRRA